VLYELRNRRGYNSNVGEQHTTAIKASNLINTELGLLKMPTLIIHGKSDPLVPFEHGKKIATLIPDAKTLWIEGMGHTLSRTYTPLMLEEIFKNIKDADKLIESGTDLKP
jgi:proline iminopeptidase